MAFTYNTSLEAPKDVVRLNLGDTIASGAYLSDEEINAVLTAESGNTDKATIRLAKNLAARFAREISIRKTGRDDEAGLHEDVIVRAKFFTALAKDFEDRLKESTVLGGIGIVSAGGSSSADSCGPAFTRNLHKVQS
ncbi:MAG: hypothetical protein M3209_00280 [Acidobacteriota bacterium]|nr:hypothetical protein [Acidobacteriota bacterium]